MSGGKGRSVIGLDDKTRDALRRKRSITKHFILHAPSHVEDAIRALLPCDPPLVAAPRRGATWCVATLRGCEYLHCEAGAPGDVIAIGELWRPVCVRGGEFQAQYQSDGAVSEWLPTSNPEQLSALSRHLAETPEAWRKENALPKCAVRLWARIERVSVVLRDAPARRAHLDPQELAWKIGLSLANPPALRKDETP